MKLKTAYDIAVVGGGPAGSMAALEASKAGLSVCLLEKTSRIGSKVRCGEAMSVNALKYFFEIKEEWVSREISYCNINSPSGVKLKTKFSSDKCIILNRDIFDYDLAVMAQNYGCEVFTKTIANDLIIKNNRVEGLVVKQNDEEFLISSKLVIAADGVESRLGRKAGIKTQVKMKDMASGIEYFVKGIDIDSDALDMYVGSQVAPGGYLWIFPKSESSANIGLAISGKHSPDKSAKKYLGEENVVDLDLRMTSEDFAYLSHEFPSCFYRLGTFDGKNTSNLHTPTFNIDEDSLEIGAGLLSYIAIQQLNTL